MVKLIIVRHCQTEGNKKALFQGSTNTPISEEGYYQLGLLSARFQDEKIDVIYSSPQERALKTAKAINRFHNVDINIVDELREIHAGDIEGTAFFDMPELFPVQAKQWIENFHQFEPPNGEKMTEVFARMSSAIEKIISENDGKTVMITSHGCSIRNLMCYLSEFPLERILEIPLGTNTAVSFVECENGEKRVTLLSNSDHLPNDTFDPKKKSLKFNK